MKKPNVIVVLVDQLRAFEVGAYGNPAIRTPHLDRLAAEGVRFDLGISNNPVCTPARSCLLSGQYGRTCTGEVGNVSDDPPCPLRRRLPDPTLADALRAAGYATALIGKWHIDPSPRTVGFDSAYYPLTVHRYRGQRFFTDEALGPVIDGFAPDHESDRVRAFLAARRDRPFFLYYNISLPHEPIGPAEMPARYARLYNPAAVPLRPNVFQDGRMAHSERWFKVYQIWDYFWRMGGPCWNAAPECGYPERIGELPSDALAEGFSLRDLTALYYGATTWVDDLVGRLLAALDDLDLAEDTLVLFTSDHGDNLGSHHLFNKDCLYEESIRIPYLVRFPGRIRPAANDAQIATLIDVMPTVLDLCGLPIPASVQGQSLAPVLRGERPTLARNVAFIETDPSQFRRLCVGIRTPSHLYGAFLGKDRRTLEEDWGLFDVVRDPYEERNLAGAAEPAGLADTLRRQVAGWNTATPWLAVDATRGTSP